MTTTSELANLWLFLLAMGKASLLCGFAPGVLLAHFGPRVAKYFCPLTLGKVYRVEGYYTGDFIGEVESVDREFAKVRVLDPLRPVPRVPNRCSFPQCVREDFHSGDHEFVRVREGVLIEVAWHAAKWTLAIRVETGSGDGQFAGNLIPSELKVWATSPSRKIQRRA